SLLLLAIWRPSFLRVLYVGWSLAAFPVGWLMSHLLLFAMYFGVFWPTGCLLRLLGWDPLRPQATIPHTTHAGPTDAKSPAAADSQPPAAEQQQSGPNHHATSDAPKEHSAAASTDNQTDAADDRPVES
ncbi:MAG: SxtJ family membrane protein, partial [Planctomycetaceae bacterium]